MIQYNNLNYDVFDEICIFVNYVFCHHLSLYISFPCWTGVRTSAQTSSWLLLMSFQDHQENEENLFFSSNDVSNSYLLHFNGMNGDQNCDG